MVKIKFKKIKSSGILYLIFSLVFINILSTSIYASYGGDVEDSDGNFHNTRKDVVDVCGLGKINPKDSFIMSVLTLCLPGVIENLYKLKLIYCDEITCMYDAVTNSLDPAFCKEESEMQTCEYFVGEIFAFPFINIVENVRKMVAHILANPVGVLSSATTFTARKVLKGKCNSVLPSTWCHAGRDKFMGAAAVVVFVTDTTSFVKTIQDIRENGITIAGDDDSCDRVPDIEKKLKEVIEATSSTSSNSNSDDESE